MGQEFVARWPTSFIPEHPLLRNERLWNGVVERLSGLWNGCCGTFHNRAVSDKPASRSPGCSTAAAWASRLQLALCLPPQLSGGDPPPRGVFRGRT